MARSCRHPILFALGVALCGVSLVTAARADSRQPPEHSAETTRPAFPVRITAATGFDFSTGEFGGDFDTDLWYVPFSLRVDWQAFTFKLTVPYVRLVGVAELSSGEPETPTRDDAAIARDFPLATTLPEPFLLGTRGGLGDVILDARYTLEPDCAYLPTTRLSGKIKFGTASRARGLGTGENDYALELDFSKPFGRVLPFAGVGYRFVGDPPSARLRDKLSAYVGASANVTRRLGAGLVYEWRQSSVPGRQDFHELQPFATFRLNRYVAIDPYLVIGLSAPAPDWGGGLQLRVIYDRR